MNSSEIKPLLNTVNMSEIETFDPLSFRILQSAKKSLLHEEPPTEKTIFLIQAIYDRTMEKINIGPYSEVAIEFRYIITIASILKALLLMSDAAAVDAKAVYEAIDHGLIFGAPLPLQPKLLQLCASVYSKNQSNERSKAEFLKESSPSPLPLTGDCISCLSCPSIEAFMLDYFIKKHPVKLLNCMNHWPALKLWNDPNYILSKMGKRTVPIEIGSKYTDDSWTQKLMTVEDFVDTFMVENAQNKGYLAQYQLFNHIPELLKDIAQPDYCCVRDENVVGKDEEDVDINAWFGPKGTVSPLHYDPKNNVLTQVVGEKTIILYSPEDSSNLYAHDSKLLHNTAQVDPKNPDYDKFPDFKKARPFRCTLKAGEMLYIPPKWWHYVESTTKYSKTLLQERNNRSVKYYQDNL